MPGFLSPSPDDTACLLLENRVAARHGDEFMIAEALCVRNIRQRWITLLAILADNHGLRATIAIGIRRKSLYATPLTSFSVRKTRRLPFLETRIFARASYGVGCCGPLATLASTYGRIMLRRICFSTLSQTRQLGRHQRHIPADS